MTYQNLHVFRALAVLGPPQRNDEEPFTGYVMWGNQFPPVLQAIHFSWVALPIASPCRLYLRGSAGMTDRRTGPAAVGQ